MGVSSAGVGIVVERPRRAVARAVGRAALLGAALLAGACATHRQTMQTGVGRSVTGASVRDVNGAEMPLASSKGGVVLLAFFTTWCPTSAGALRSLDGLRTRDAARGVEAIAVDEGDTAEDVALFVERHRLQLRIGLDQYAVVGKDWALPTVPAVFVIDREGTVRFTHSGFHGEEDQQAIDREVSVLLAEGPSPIEDTPAPPRPATLPRERVDDEGEAAIRTWGAEADPESESETR